MPRKVLYPLSVLACVYAIYSLCCYWFAAKKWRPFLIVIAVANLMYCCITIALVVLFYYALTVLGVIYFVGEILVIIGLVYIEALAISESNDMHLPRVTSKP